MKLGFLFSPILIGILAVLCTLFVMTRDRRTMKIISTVLFAVSFVTGFTLYVLGYLSFSANAPEMFLAALRGLFSTGRMFLINDDYGFLTDTPDAQWLVGNIWIQIAFWLAHVFALTVSISTLMAIFGRKLIWSLRLRYGLHRQVYIITGTEQRALTLGENIATRDKTTTYDVNRLVVFLADKAAEAENSCEVISSFGAVLIETYNGLLASVVKTGLGKWYGRGRSYKVIMMEDNSSAVDSVQMLMEYALQKHVAPQKLEIFMLSKSEWDRQGIERLTGAYPYSLHITDESSIAARQLLLKHPAFKVLSFNNGVASRDLTVMIIGFGNVGQQALLRLIMNGQFVGSRMRAVIIDAEIENLRGRFLHRHQSLNLCCEMVFHAVDVRNEDFYALLKQTGPIDYAVLALDNEEQSKQAAQDLHMYYLHSQKKPPLIAVAAESNDVPWDNTVCFGRRMDIYTEAALIHEEADRRAMAVNSVYMRGENAPDEDIYSLWQNLDWFSRESNRASADFIPAMLHLAGLTAEQAKERNKLTEDTALAETLAHTEHLRWMAFHAVMGYSPISLDEMRRRFEMLSDADNRLTLCRKDEEKRLHLCLVPWEKLDEIGDAYNEIVKRAGKFTTRDFKADDYQVVQNVPLFLRDVL